MAKLKIYRDNTELVEVNIGDDTIRESYFMGDDRVRVSFSNPEIIDFLPYDYIIHNGKRYSIKGNEMPTRKEYGKRRFDYDIVFKSPEYRMHDMPLSHLGESKFDYFGTPSQILQLVIDCMSVIDNGFVLEIDEPADIEPLHIYFENVTCRQAVTQACELFGLEYNFDGHVLYVGKSVGNRLEGFTFSQGKGNGLYTLTEVSVPDSPFATRFYGFGGSENLPLDYKSGRKNLVMTGEFVERNIDLYGLIVQNVYFDDIFPTRTGVLTAVSSDFLTLTDTSIDFNLNDQQIEGAKIVFTSGELGGQEFEIASYNHATKAMRINRLEESEGYFLPNATFSPKVGDKYKLVGIIMPETYIIAAENEVAEKTIEYAEKHSHPSVGFELELDELELRRRGLVGQLNVGTWIHVVSTKLSVDRYLRITELSYPLANPSKITAKISDVVSYTLAERILKDVSSNKNELATIEREQKRDFTILSRKSAEQAKLQAERLNELREYIFDADNYFDATKIKPQSIETQMLSVGAKSQNFYLSGVTMQPNYLGDANRFYVSSGQLQHREISIAAGFIWNLTAQAFYALEPNKTYYLSAKCSKTTLTGTFDLSDTPKTVEIEAGYYHFNIGVLYPVSADGKRYFANTSGVSYVVGSQITTGRLKSLDGNTWFDLDTGEIRGAIKFTSGQTVESAIEQAKGEAVAQSGVASQQAIAALSIGGRNLVAKSKMVAGYLYPYSGDLFYYDDFHYDPEYYIADSDFYYYKNYTKSENVVGYILWYDENKSFISSSFEGWSSYETLIQKPQVAKFYRINVANLTDKIKIEKGNKATDWTPAPEDLQQLVIDTDNARKAYVDSQDNLKEVQTKAYADGIVSAEEARAIADATNKANAAKSYADAQDVLLKAQADAYADGKVSAEEQARINQAQANLQAAKDYAAAQDNLAKVETKAYADGIVDAEEARAIADAQDKLNEAKSHANTQASQAQANAIIASNTNISNAINALSIGGRNYAALSKIKGYTGGNLVNNVPYYTVEGSKVIATNQPQFNYVIGFKIPVVVGKGICISAKSDVLQTVESYRMYFDKDGNSLSGQIVANLAKNGNHFELKLNNNDVPVNASYMNIGLGSTSLLDYSLYEISITHGDKVMDWTPAPEDFQQQIIDTDNARKAYVDSQDNLKEIQTKAYADGKITDAESRAIADATAKANAAKAYADAQDTLLKVQTEAYADGVVSAEETARIADAQAKLNEAKSHAEAQALQAQDNAINSSNANLTNAINALSFGGRNLILNSADVILNGNDYQNSSNHIKGVITVKDNPNNWNSYSFFTLSEQVKIGDEVVYSVEVKSDKAITISANYMPHYPHNNFVSQVTLTPNVWTKIVCKGVIANAYGDMHLSGFTGMNASGAVINYKNLKVERGNKATDWTPAPEDLQQMVIDTDNARKSYIDAQDNLKEVQVKAYADGIVSAEEARAIADATAKANAAKSYADNLKVQTETYINSIVNPIQSVFDSWKIPGKTTINGTAIETESIRAASIIVEGLIARYFQTNNVGARTTINVLPTDSSNPTSNENYYQRNAIRQYHESGRISMYEGIVTGVVIKVNGVNRTVNGHAKVVFKDESDSPILYVVDSYTQNGMQYNSGADNVQYFQVTGHRLLSTSLGQSASDEDLINLLFTQDISTNDYTPRSTFWCGNYQSAMYTLSLGIIADTGTVWKRVSTVDDTKFVTLNNGSTPITSGWYYRLGDYFEGYGTFADDWGIRFNLTIQLHYIDSLGKISQQKNLTIENIFWNQMSIGVGSCNVNTPQSQIFI